MKTTDLSLMSFALTLAMAFAVASPSVQGQVPLAWDATQYFHYNIENVEFDPGTRVVTVMFSVSNPQKDNELWDIQHDVPFTASPAFSRLAIDIGWDTSDYTNTGSTGEDLDRVPFGMGTAAATPISIDALRLATPLPSPLDRVYVVTAALPKQAAHTGVVVMEGHPAWPVDDAGTLARVPVKTEVRYFSITGAQVARREVVDLQKCQACHNGGTREGVTIPRLSLHGANRNEELRACVVCHNPNQTDIAYRESGAEVSLDFKRMVHAIHGTKRRKTPLVIVGFRGSINDFSHIKFPAEVKNCLVCHIEERGKGTFELPLESNVLGSTIDTGSVPGVDVDVDPSNDARITPTAAVCSSCHDSKSAISHMSRRRSGGGFGVLQLEIDLGIVRERCVDCHGPGRDKDVRKVHSVEKYELPGED
jgi:OmcA/MtrC family decaheme c-type cytochrome